MATAEGEYPKVGNDPLYSSEVNRFAGAGFTIVKSDFTGIGSNNGLAPNSTGSIVIPAGSLTLPGMLIVRGTNDLGTRGTPRLQYSGTDFGANFATLSTSSVNDGPEYFTATSFIVSGTSMTKYIWENQSSDSRNESIQGNVHYANSGLVIFFNLQHSGASHNWKNAIVESRGVV